MPCVQSGRDISVCISMKTFLKTGCFNINESFFLEIYFCAHIKTYFSLFYFRSKWTQKIIFIHCLYMVRCPLNTKLLKDLHTVICIQGKSLVGCFAVNRAKISLTQAILSPSMQIPGHRSLRVYSKSSLQLRIQGWAESVIGLGTGSHCVCVCFEHVLHFSVWLVCHMCDFIFLHPLRGIFSLPHFMSAAILFC